jgi:hypothetical protein
MKTLINEVERFQKIAGIIKEEMSGFEQSQGMEEAAPKGETIKSIVKQLNKIANSKGFYAVDKSPDKGGVKNLVKWENHDEDFVELQYSKKGNVDDLIIHYKVGGPSAYIADWDDVSDWMDPSTWDTYFDEEELSYAPSKDLTPEEELQDDIEEISQKINELRDELEMASDKEERVIRKELTQLNKELDKLMHKQEKLYGKK